MRRRKHKNDHNHSKNGYVAGNPRYSRKGSKMSYSNHWPIVRNNREAYKAVKAGDCLSNHDKLYTELYNHFASNGDMPYGVMKARDGDPYEWIMEQVWD